MSTSATTAGAGASQGHFHVKGLRWWIAILLMGVTVINYLDRGCLSVAGPTLKKLLSIDEKSFAHVIMAFQLTYLLMQPVTGRIIDWLNIRAGVAVSILWWSAAQMLTAFSGGWVSFAIFRALLGVGEAGNFPAVAKTASQWFRPSERTLATAVINQGSSIGQILAPPLVVYLIMTASWQMAFVATGAIGVAWVGLWLYLYRSPETHPALAPEELAYIQAGQKELAVHDQGATEGVWKVVLPQRNFWGLAVARFLSEPAWQLFTYWIPLYLTTTRHIDLKGIKQFAWIPFVAADIGSLFGGVLSPLFIRLGASVLTARKLAATVSGVLMFAVIFTPGAPSVEWAIFFFCIGAFAHQSMSATLLTLPADLFPKRTVATSNGLSGTVGLLGGMLFTWVVGETVGSVGYGPLFVGIAFFDLIGAGLLWILLRDPPGEADALPA